MLLGPTKGNKSSVLEPDLVELVATEELPVRWQEKGLLIEKIRSLTGEWGADMVVDFMPVGGELGRWWIAGWIFIGVKGKHHIASVYLGNLD